jgi:hypothetical protein
LSIRPLGEPGSSKQAACNHSKPNIEFITSLGAK